MTDLARRALRALPRIAGQSTPVQPNTPAREVNIEVWIPEDLLKQGGPARDALATRLRELCAELRVPAELDLTFLPAPVGHSDVAMSIGDRPVALLPADTVAGSDRPAEVLCRYALQGTLRRLPLLLGAEPESQIGPYLLAVGCALPDGCANAGSGVGTAERLIEQLVPKEIVLEVAPDTMRRVDGAKRRAVAEFREAEFRKRGIRYPDVRVEIRDGATGTLRMRLNHVTLPLVTLGDDADWATVVARLSEQLAARRHWFVHLGQVNHQLTYEMEYVFPELVSATRGAFTLEEITGCLRELLRSGRRIRNVPRILWLMLEQGDAHGKSDMLRLSESPLTPRGGRAHGVGRDPVVLAARVRKIASEEAWRTGSFNMPLYVRRLDVHLEERLVSADGGGIGAAEWEVTRAVAADPDAERIVTRTIEAIGPVRDAVQALGRPLRVMASQELPPDIDLDRFAVIAEVVGRRGT